MNDPLSGWWSRDLDVQDIDVQDIYDTVFEAWVRYIYDTEMYDRQLAEQDSRARWLNQRSDEIMLYDPRLRSLSSENAAWRRTELPHHLRVSHQRIYDQARNAAQHLRWSEVVRAVEQFDSCRHSDCAETPSLRRACVADSKKRNP